jgi:hypothetical protein
MRNWQQIPKVAGSQNLKKFYKGGFDDKMNRREALLILGLR